MNNCEINMDETYRCKTDIDEWGCASVWLDEDETMGAEYNYCIDRGESYCAIYGFTQFPNDDTYYTDYDCYYSYDIEWDKKDWKKRLANKMMECAMDWKNNQREKFIEWELKHQ